ncbi:hypothetical protein ACFFX0_30175 [Citricoccus parietis]|uniref:SAP domain-containing protein n=1 Tax=Citricoccus parietis TaxID=592307 RepID=A0ABV5G8F9_9MICC
MPEGVLQQLGHLGLLRPGHRDDLVHEVRSRSPRQPGWNGPKCRRRASECS